MLAMLAMLLGAAAIVGQELLLNGSGDAAAAARPLTADEAGRLATMRRANHADARAGVAATIGQGPHAARFTGWVDWRHPMVYLARSEPASGELAELVQAVPGMVAVRDGTGADSRRNPPADPPADGWRIRQPGGDGPAAAPTDPGTVDALAVLLLSITAEQADSAELLAGSEARWLRRDRAGEYEVDVLLGPAVPPRTPPAGPRAPQPAPDRSLAAMGGAVQYWLDGQARLHRLEALLTEATMVRIDLDRTDRTAPPVLDVLGGAATDPRPVTGAQAQVLAALRQRNREAAGGEVSVTLPGPAGERIRAAGWLDWRQLVGYLATYRNGAPDGLVWADGGGIGNRSDLPPRAGRPPLPIPRDEGWQWVPWHERGDAEGGYDLDLLLNEALALSSWQPDDADTLRETARWLRADTVGGAAVTVYEIPRPIESDVEPGQARLRYWVDDGAGVLRRLEIRTRAGGWGQLDFSPGTFPPLA
jgi:hypothetical protein